MKDSNAVIYMVTYKDDFRKTHITFVRGFSAVNFLKDRFGEITFEITERFYSKESNKKV